MGISDGDTITVLLEGNTQKKLRLAEVDCPESGQPFGKNAKQFTSGQVFGKQISFIETDTDRYGRTIAKVYYDNGKYVITSINSWNASKDSVRELPAPAYCSANTSPHEVVYSCYNYSGGA